MQLRINMERMTAEGDTRPSAGTLSAFELPSGPGLRTDTFGYVGYATSTSFDSLLAKLIVHSRSADFADLVTRAYRALCEFKIEGVATNVGFLQNLLQHAEFAPNRLYTRFVEDHWSELASAEGTPHQRLFFAEPAAGPEAPAGPALAGARVDATNPLAVLDHYTSEYWAVADENGDAAGEFRPVDSIFPAPAGATIEGRDIAGIRLPRWWLLFGMIRAASKQEDEQEGAGG